MILPTINFTIIIIIITSTMFLTVLKDNAYTVIIHHDYRLIQPGNVFSGCSFASALSLSADTVNY